MVWNRVVFDEGHVLRNIVTQQTQAALNLKANYKWIVSGTPIQNRIDDLYSLIKIIEYVPFCNSTSSFKNLVTKKYEQGDVDEVQKILKPVVLKRLKTDVGQKE